MKDTRPIELARHAFEGLLHQSLLAEGSKGCDATLHSYPVDLEPHFGRFDPSRIHASKISPGIPEDPVPERAWSSFRLRLPRQSIAPNQVVAAIEASSIQTTRFAFEIVADAGKADVYLVADDPESASFMRDAWLSHCPGVVLIPWEDPWKDLLSETDLRVWEAYPLPLTPDGWPFPARRTLPLLLRQAARLRAGVRLVYQILFQSVRHDWHRNIYLLTAAETTAQGRIPWRHTTQAAIKPPDQPLVAAILRIALLGGADSPAVDPARYWAGFSQGGRPLQVRRPVQFREVLDQPALLSMLSRRRTHAPGVLLTAEELSAFIQVPEQATTTLRIDWTRGLEVPTRFQASGRLLGFNYSHAEPTPVRLPDTERNRSIYQIGSSRKGKSNSILHQCLELARSGSGLALIDPHRSTAFDLVRALPPEALDRVVWCDFQDPDFVLDYNPFDAPDSFGRRATEYVHSFKHLFEAGSFHRMGRILGLGVHALFDLKENLATFSRLFAATAEGERLRARVIARSQNPDVQRFFADEVRSLPSEAITPILNRISTLLLDESARRIFERRENKLDIPTILREGRLLVVALPSNIDVANIVGGMLLAQIQKAGLARIGRDEPDFYVFLDEFHRFLNSAKILESLLNECAKAGLFLCMAHQETGQLSTELFRAALTAPLLMVFGVNYEDARKFVPIFNGRIQVDDLLSLRVGEVCARLDQDIVDFRCPPPPADLSEERARHVIEASRRLYYTPIHEIGRSRKTTQSRHLDHF